jgi:hypothetical protein
LTFHLLDSVSVSILWTQLLDRERAKIGELSQSEDDQPVERNAIMLEMAEMLELETERRRRIEQVKREWSRVERGGLHPFKAESIESYKGKISSCCDQRVPRRIQLRSLKRHCRGNATTEPEGFA